MMNPLSLKSINLNSGNPHLDPVLLMVVGKGEGIVLLPDAVNAHVQPAVPGRRLQDFDVIDRPMGRSASAAVHGCNPSASAAWPFESVPQSSKSCRAAIPRPE